jgi:hypothetical protein
MPRPKPPEDLKPRAVRLSDSEWKKFREWGGAEKLRLMLGTQPASYYNVFVKGTNQSTNQLKVNHGNS